MKEKIKITHEDLNHPKVDEILSFISSGEKIYKGEDKKPGGILSFIGRHWLHLLITALIGALVVLILLKILFSLHPGEKKPENNRKIIQVRANNEALLRAGKSFLKNKEEEKWVVI